MRIQFESSHEIEISKSRFLCYLNRAESEEEARAFIASVRRLHPKATHVCSAFLIDASLQRSSDDNEPAGTAGIPMLETLRKRNMDRIVAATVRYFGGIKLGAGGLVRAYSQSVSEALDHASLYEVREQNIYRLTLDYSSASRLEKILKEVRVLDKSYREEVILTFAADDDAVLTKINEVLLGKADIRFLERKEIETAV